MRPGDVWLATFAAALGVGPVACGQAPPPSPAVASHEVTAWDASAAPSSSDASPDPPAPAGTAPAQDAGATPAHLDSFDVVAVARPKTQGAAPKPPPDPCAGGRHTPSCERAAICGAVPPRAAMRAGLEFETRAGLAPKSTLDAAAAASARRAITAVERQAYLCAVTYVSDSTLVSIELVTAGGTDGVHARITGIEATPEFTACMIPGLENGTWFASSGSPRSLRFDLSLRAVWR